MCIITYKAEQPSILGKHSLQEKKDPIAKIAKQNDDQDNKPQIKDKNTNNEQEIKVSAAAASPAGPKKLRGFLIAAAQRGNLEKIKAVMEDDKYEVDVAESRMGCTPLHYACFYNHVNIAEYLINASAPIDAQNQAGRTPLFWAVEKKAYETVAFLLESEADPSICDTVEKLSPLHVAAKNGDYKMIETLLSINTETEEWTKLNDRTVDGFTAVSFAAHQGNLDMVALLFEYGADLNIVSTENKLSPLHRAVSRGHIETIRYLLENGADVDAKDSLGRTSLHLAVSAQNMDVVKLLLTFSPTICADEAGTTQLDYAADQNNPELFTLIESYNYNY